MKIPQSPAGGHVGCFQGSALANNVDGNVSGHGAIYLEKEHWRKNIFGRRIESRVEYVQA